MTRKITKERLEEFRRFRSLLPAALSMLSLLVLAGALYFEQIRSGEKHRHQVSKQSLRQIRIPARRGLIYTADLKLLTENTPAFEVLFFPAEMKKRKQKSSIEYMLSCADTISKAAGVPHGLTYEKIRRHLNMRPGLPLHVLRDLSDAAAARAMEAARSITGAVIQPMERRTYPEKRLACHLIGYTRPGDPRQAPDRKNFFYYLPDDVGVSGLEKACDNINSANNLPGLKGIPGYSLIQVDHLGYARKSLIERIDPVNGNHVILTIDSAMQKTAENLLRGKNGAFVAIDADNGDILAAASSPGYDLGLFAGRISSENYTQLHDDPARPLFNRALQGIYPPGSILKPLIALAFLQEGVDPEKKIDCTGHSEIYGVKIRCASYRRGGHGLLNMHDALKYSCNTYMIEYAKKVGLAPMQQILRAAGLGEKTGICLPESAGIFPSDPLKRRRTRIPWNTYDTALLSIGQGLIGVTPLQAALFCGALANGGKVWQPNIIARTVDSAGQDIWLRKPQIKRKLPVPAEHLQAIADAMLDVVNSGDGSGREGHVPDLKICGKTGSAEYGRRENLKIFAWFIAHARVHGRNIATALVVQDGESGGRTCAPLTAEFFTALKKQLQRPEPTEPEVLL